MRDESLRWFIITSIVTSESLIGLNTMWGRDEAGVCLWEEMIHWWERGYPISFGLDSLELNKISSHLSGHSAAWWLKCSASPRLSDVHLFDFQTLWTLFGFITLLQISLKAYLSPQMGLFKLSPLSSILMAQSNGKHMKPSLCPHPRHAALRGWRRWKGSGGESWEMHICGAALITRKPRESRRQKRLREWASMLGDPQIFFQVPLPVVVLLLV